MSTNPGNDHDPVHAHLVVGGGLTGLGRAWRLASQGKDVVLLESADRLGGTIATVAEAGYRIDVGGAAVAGPAPHLEALLGSLPDAPTLTAAAPLWRWGRRGLEIVRRPLPPRRILAPLLRLPLPPFDVHVRLFARGIGGLPGAMAGSLMDRARTGVRVASLTRRDGIWLAMDEGGATWRAREVWLALPAAEQARLLDACAPHHAEVLAAIPHLSVVRIAAGMHGPAPRHAAAFVRSPGAPGRLGRGVVTSMLEPERAPRNRWLVQTALTDVDAPGSVHWSDETLEAVIVADLRRVFGRPIRLDALRLARHEHALPAPYPGHRARVAAMQSSLGDLGLHLLGDHVLGPGLDRRCVPAAPTHAPPLEGVELV